MRRATFSVRGVVQGVGFRPYVYRLARECGLVGAVWNTSSGVIVDAQGTASALDAFARRLPHEAPALAEVQGVERTEATVDPALTGFAIVASAPEAGSRTVVPPDTGCCEDCLRELFDPADRRYRHPFITCTNCGPRFTIIESLPYDRPGTTLARMPMCAACSAEYRDPADRRFHAQPVSCKECGPRLWFRESASEIRDDERCLAEAVRVLATGGVLALKGIGGYHLACSALDAGAVRTLRARKAREAKPLAVMVPDVATARAICDVSDAEAAELAGPARPIVLLRRRTDAPVAREVAPGNDELGVMLAYAPVHHILFADGAPRVLVMTSGNLSGEPICFADGDALERLAPIADAFLGHDRPIAVPCDDSVVRVMDGRVHPLRRSRGYAPVPVPWRAPVAGRRSAAAPSSAVFAVGGELKATVCLLADSRAYMSQHLGDMESLAGQDALAFAARHLAALYGVRPNVWACDLHPDYHSRRWAERNHGEAPLLPVQHHHAHAAALLAEHRRVGDDVLVFAFDGTGYGTDGAIWGGEALLLGDDVSRFARFGHLAEVRLPGGDAAVAEPWRIALAHLAAAGLGWDGLPCTRAAGEGAERLRQVLAGTGATPCTSMGRLFDGVAALLGVCQSQGYEAQAAIELEQAARGQSAEPGLLPVAMGADGTVDPGPMLAALIESWRQGRPGLARAFHEWVLSCVVRWAMLARDARGVATVGLTGGVFANELLASGCTAALAEAGFDVLTHTRVPAGDGGLALGQAVVADAYFRAKES